MRKKTVLTVIIIMLVLIGVFIYLFNKLDFFKNNQQLFWKYALKNSEIIRVFNNEEIDEVKNKKSNSSYTINSELNIQNNDQNYKIISRTNAKNRNDILTTVTATTDSTEIADFNIVKKSNIVGLKMDELANGYITLKNTNLKDLTKKIGLEDTESFPDNINMSTLIDVLEISDDDKDYLSNKFSNIIIVDTNSENYNKEKSVSVKIDEEIHISDAYKISLTENECKKILSDIFKNLSKDSRALNLISSKLKMLNLSSRYTNVNNLSSKFSEISDKIDSIDTNDEEFIEVTVYVENENLIQTDVKINNERTIKLIYDEENKKIHIKQEFTSGNYRNNKFILTISDLLNNMISKIDQIDISTEVSEDKSILSTNVKILCKDNINIIYNSTTEITDNVEENIDYENSNKIILNDLSDEQLKNLYNAIKSNLLNIYKDKKAILQNE